MHSYYGIGSIERTVTVLQKHKAKQSNIFIKLIDGQKEQAKTKYHLKATTDWINNDLTS